jgi:superfamily I DNA and/or RNA helicase
LNFGQVTVDQNPFFTHLFIDEAAQATEPEILCPISCVINPSPPYRKVEIALIGDPRQLSPRVYHKNVADSLGRSFMERLLRRPVTCVGGGEESLLGPMAQPDYLSTGSLSDLIRYYANVDGQEQLTIFLTQNYRGHPSFLMMPSAFFYFDRLESARDPNPDTNSYWCNKLRAVEALSRPVHAPIATFAESDCSETNVMAQCIKQK